MRCRRCKTNFDYEAHYGICPKCAAYNRPDGKDDMKTFLGEGAGAFEEEYHPPVMSSEGMEEFMWQGETTNTPKVRTKNPSMNHPKKNQKSFQERLSNPYLDNTAKKGKKKAGATEKKRSGKKWGQLVLVIIIILIYIASEFMDEIVDFVQKIYEESYEEYLEAPDSSIPAENTACYTDSWSVAGREISFGAPYELRPANDWFLDENESLLFIPYQVSVEDEESADTYEMECYLNDQELYLQPVSPYALEEVCGYSEEDVGTLSGLIYEEEKNLVFVGNFSAFEEDPAAYLNISFREAGKTEPLVVYRIIITGGEMPTAEWTRETFEDESLEAGYSSPVITRIGSSYQGYEAAEGYVFYKIVQQFENHGQTPMDFVDMTLYCTDLTNYEEIYTWSGEEGYEENDPLNYYKLHILPPGELGTRTTILEVPEGCKKIMAALYFGGERKEWQASL